MKPTSVEVSGSASAGIGFSQENAEYENQYLTFLMADEEYGVDILAVQEIRGWEVVTPIPNAASFVKGVINLRGVIVPIIDLRQKFGVPNVTYGPLTVVIVMKVEINEVERVMGMVVDAVSDVYSIDPSVVRTAPNLGDHVDTDYLEGLVTIDKKMIILLNIGELLSDDQIRRVDINAMHQVMGETQ